MTKVLPSAQAIYDTLLAAQSGRSDNTRRIARSQAVHVANWYATQRPNQAFTDADRDAYLNARKAAGASKSSADNEWKLIRACLRGGPAYSTAQTRAAGVPPAGSRIAEIAHERPAIAPPRLALASDRDAEARTRDPAMPFGSRERTSPWRGEATGYVRDPKAIRALLADLTDMADAFTRADDIRTLHENADAIRIALETRDPTPDEYSKHRPRDYPAYAFPAPARYEMSLRRGARALLDLAARIDGDEEDYETKPPLNYRMLTLEGLKRLTSRSGELEGRHPAEIWRTAYMLLADDLYLACTGLRPFIFPQAIAKNSLYARYAESGQRLRKPGRRIDASVIARIESVTDDTDTRRLLLRVAAASGIGPNGACLPYRDEIAQYHACGLKPDDPLRAWREQGRLIGGLFLRDELWEAVTDRIGVRWGVSEYHMLVWACREYCCVRGIDLSTMLASGQSVGDAIARIDRVVEIAGTAGKAQYAAHLAPDARAHFEIVAEQFVAVWTAKENSAALEKTY